jgi:hypothetical protein
MLMKPEVECFFDSKNGFVTNSDNVNDGAAVVGNVREALPPSSYQPSSRGECRSLSANPVISSNSGGKT